MGHIIGSQWASFYAASLYGKRGYVAKTRKKKMERKRPSSIFLDNHSKEFGDQCNLPSHITFCHSLYLPFPDHVHDQDLRS
jgi:hypothetical protein